MASIYKTGDSYAIQIGAGNARRVRRIGNLSKAGAADVEFHVEKILQARRVASIPSPSTIAWLENITDDLHAKLAELGLVEPRAVVGNLGVATTIGKLFDDYLERRRDLKRFTRANIDQAKKRCVAFFGVRRADSITTRDVKDFVRAMQGEQYAAASITGYVAKARQVYADAIDHEVLFRNPFRGIKTGGQVNRKRHRFIPADQIERVIAVAPSPAWRLLIALARYAGLRIPSEAIHLRAGDVDLARGRFVVHSSKTEKQGKATREVPIFPELRPHFEAAIAALPPGDDKLIPFVVDGYNPHTQFVRLIRRAGLTPWAKCFQNLRSTRETELLAQGWAMHKVTAWIGNTENVANAHYLQVTDDDFAAATGGALHKALHLQPASIGSSGNIGGTGAVYAPENAETANSDDVHCPQQGHNERRNRRRKPSARPAALQKALHLPAESRGRRAVERAHRRVIGATFQRDMAIAAEAMDRSEARREK